MAQSAQANYSTNAFADWLSKKAEPANGSTLQQELEDLRRSNKHFDEVIEKASQIVSQNNEKFTLAIVEAMVTQQLCQLLFIEWNQFQVDNTMSGVPVQNPGKTLSANITKDFTPADSFALPSENTRQGKSSEKYFSIKADVTYALIPMISGIAIGAP